MNKDTKSIHQAGTTSLKVMKRAASFKQRQAVKTKQCEKKLLNFHLQFS